MSYLTVKVHFDASMITENKETTPIVLIKEGDMFNYALDKYIGGKKVCVHNFANNISPGLFREDPKGNHIFLTNTQEEQLLRSSLVKGKIYLPLEMYPICADDKSSSALLTKDVAFTKDRKKGFRIPKSDQYIADVITCAAIDLPDITDNGKYVNKQDEETTLNRMILVINMAKDADIFITGLWGCGAFCHPIKEVIRLWKQAINISANTPKEIMFCHYLDSFTNISSKDEENIKIMEGLI